MIGRTRSIRLGLEILEAKRLLAVDGADLARDAFDVQQNATVQSLDILANDRFDADYAGDKLITDTSLGSLGGSIEIAADKKSVSYTPPADGAGTETFTYFVDGDFSAEVSVSIIAPLRDDSIRLVPDRASYSLNVMDNDGFWNDYEGERRITLVSASSIGANVEISEDGKSLIYTRREHTYGGDTLTYIVDERYPANVSIEMVDPLKDDRFEMVQFDPPKTVQVLVGDPFWSGYQGARKVTHILDVPEGASAEIVNDGTAIRFSPNDIPYGSYSMRYVVDGQYEASFFARMHRPVRDDNFTVDENSQHFRVNLLSNDNYRSIFNFQQVIDVVDRITDVSESEQDATISITPDGQGVFYSPSRDFTGNDTFTYIADGLYEAKVSVNVRDPLEGTGQRDDYYTVFQGTVDNTLRVLDNDFFGDGYQGARVITAVGDVEGAAVTIAADRKSLRFTAGDEQNYHYTFTYEVDNAFTGTVRVGIQNIARSETFWFVEPRETTLRILDRLEFPSTYAGDQIITEVGAPDKGGSASITSDNRSVRYEPGVGAETFTYTVDGKYTGTIRVAYRQRLNYDYHVAHQNSGPQPIDVLANDFDSYSESRWGHYTGPRVITHVESITGNGVVTIADNGKSILFEPNEDFVGDEQVRYVVDGFLEATVSIDVARLLRHDRMHVDPGSTADLNVLDNDLVGGDYDGPLNITAVTGGSVGAAITVAADGKSVFYTPAQGFTGQDVFEYTVDGQLKANVVVEVNPSVADLYPKFDSLDAFKQLVLENTKLGTDFDLSLEDGLGGDALAPGAKRDHSETNVQVEGVDEADLIETDSDYLYTLTQGQLVIAQAWPADQLQVLSRTEIPGVAIGQYLHGDRLAVISQEQNFIFFDDFGPVDGIFRGDVIWPYPVPDPLTYITVLDVSNRAEPKLVQRTEIEGNHVQTRRIDDYVYLVVRDSESVVPQRQQICEGEGEDEVCRIETDEERLERIENDFASVVEDLLPNYESFGPDGKLARGGLLIQPEDIFDPISEGSSSLISVVAIDITNSEPGLASATGVLTTGASQLYVTAENLYVFEEHFSWFGSPSELEDNPTTKILKFQLERETGGVQFASTGQVPGRMLNQFSADEHDDHLRVATTINNSHSGNYSGGQENALFVLRDDQGVLEHVGTIQNLALNETIQSVRFFGDRVMMTTFRAIDPLFSINLSDHENPFVEGHLTLPGFASYMQFVDAEHMLTIGRSTAIGWGGAVAISLFEVSNILQPVLIDQFNWEHFAHSPASTDHHAFGWFPNHDTLAIPAQTSFTVRTDEDGDGYKENPERVTEHRLHAFGINTEPDSRDDSGIVVNGTIQMDSPLLRSAYIEDKLYAIATESIKSAEVSNPNNVIAEVDISRPDEEPEEPIEDPRLPIIGQLRGAARADLSNALEVRPEEIMMVATEADADETKMLLRVADEHFVYHGLGDQLEMSRLDYRFQNVTPQHFDWHNERNPLDTNGDGFVSPLDALLVINAINDGLLGALPTGNVFNQIDPIVDPYMVDTNGDGYASAIDALRVIAHINAQMPYTEPTVEPQAADAVLASAFLATELDEDEDE